jgi:hypothetical protein
MAMRESLCRAARSLRPASETEMLMGLIDQMLESTARASGAIDDALEFIEASNNRMEALEARWMAK